MKFLSALLQGILSAGKTALQIGLGAGAIGLAFGLFTGGGFLPALAMAGSWGLGGAALGGGLQAIGLIKGHFSGMEPNEAGGVVNDSAADEVLQWDNNPTNAPDKKPAMGTATVEEDKEDKKDEEVEETTKASDVHKELIDGEVKRESHAKRKKIIRDRPNKHKPSNM